MICSNKESLSTRVVDGAEQRSGATMEGVVLVVDDELPNRLYLKKLLSSYGCDVRMAANGPDALNQIHQSRPDLVLADVVMPDMDGFELCGAIKELRSTRDIPVIMVTAKGHIDDLTKGFDLGAMDYIRKPFDARELVLRVGNALALKRSRDALAHWKRRVSHELELAGAIQQSIFSDIPCFSGPFEIRIRYRASMDIGGDAYDVIELPGGRCCVYVADVSGHGVAPAMISSMLKATATELIRVHHEKGPAAICNELHVRLCNTLNNPSYYATLFMAIYEPEGNYWRCMNCGHPDPMLVIDGCSAAIPQGGGGIPVGMPMGPERPYSAEDEMVISCSGKMNILMYTDGLSEAFHNDTGEECGPDRLARFFLRVLEQPDHIERPDALLHMIEEEGYALGNDDCTAITISMIDPEQILFEASVPIDMDDVADMCERLEQAALQRDAGEDVAARVRLVAIEHAMNVVEHSGLSNEHRLWVRLLQDDHTFRLIFLDAGREWDHSSADEIEFSGDDYAEGGRGIVITNVAADGVERYRRNMQNVVGYVFKKQVDGDE